MEAPKEPSGPPRPQDVQECCHEYVAGSRCPACPERNHERA